jgi:hypothetical protein
MKLAAGKTVETLAISKPAKNADRYWGNEDLVEQEKTTVVIFEILQSHSITLPIIMICPPTL